MIFLRKIFEYLFVDDVRSHRGGFIPSLLVQFRVVRALMLRGALIRHGHDNLGFFWVIGEPLLLTVCVMILWSLAGMGHGHGVGVAPFVLSAYTMLTLWRHVVGYMGHAVKINAGLLFHRNIKMMDVILAHVILESIGGFSAFIIAYVLFWLYGFMPDIYSPLDLVGGWLSMTWLAFSFGLIIAGVSEIFEVAEHFIQPLMYITLPFTGAFFMLDWMPESVQKVLSWSAIIHAFEMFRFGLFGVTVNAKFDIGYIVLACLTLTSLGIFLLKLAEKRVHAQ